MKKIVILIIILACILFSKEETYYRKITSKHNNEIIATYVNKSNDTLETINMPGSFIPFSIVVKDGVLVDSKIILKKKELNEQDTTITDTTK